MKRIALLLAKQSNKVMTSKVQNLLVFLNSLINKGETMKTYTFYVASQNLRISVAATNKQTARETVIHQCNIKTSQADKVIICLGINLESKMVQS